jgi:hypothetical protein
LTVNPGGTWSAIPMFDPIDANDPMSTATAALCVAAALAPLLRRHRRAAELLERHL